MSRARGELLGIRVDANREIGVGHWMRCLALGQAWADAGGRVRFIGAWEGPTLERRLRSEGFEVHRLPRRYPGPGESNDVRGALADALEAFLVLDGYGFDPEYHRKVSAGGRRLLVIDDNAHLPRYNVDVLLNQNVHAASLHYVTPRNTRRLLGPRYVLLRREFRRRRTARRGIPKTARRILVTLGGGDPHNVTERVMEALARSDRQDLDITVVVRPDNPHLPTLREAADRSPHPTDIVVDPPDMASIMAEAHLAVTGGGTTIWELAHLSIPSLAVVLAENQVGAVDALNGKGVLRRLGWHADLRPDDIGHAIEMLARDAKTRETMSRRGRALVDGRGTERVIKALRAYREQG